MKDIINDINVLIENTGYSINKNDLDIEQLKNINSRLKEVRSKLNLLTIPVVVGQSEQLICEHRWKEYEGPSCRMGWKCSKCKEVKYFAT